MKKKILKKKLAIQSEHVSNFLSIIHAQDQKIDELITENNNNKEIIEQLQAKITQLNSNITEQEIYIAQLNQSEHVSNFLYIIHAQDQKIDELIAENNNNKEIIEQLQAKITQLNNNITEQEIYIAQLKRNMKG